MFTQLIKRLFPAKQTDRCETDAKIDALEKELAEIKELLKHQDQTINIHSTVQMKMASPTVTIEQKKHSHHPEESSRAALMDTSFHNRVLMGTWRGKASYLQENGKYLNGEIVLKIDQCCFYIPPDRLNPHVRIRIKHHTSNPIRFENAILTITSQEGLKTFSVPEGECDRLQLWLEKRLPKLEKVRALPNVFLGFSDKDKDYPHPFLLKHTSESMEVRKYLRQQFPVFGKPLPWYDGTVRFSVGANQTQLLVGYPPSGEEWSWTETEDHIQIVLSILEAGFFDDSESEFHFEYTITYLGNALKENEYQCVNNSKLSKQPPLSKWSKPDTENFIVENPFGMSGFYRIEWQATSR